MAFHVVFQKTLDVKREAPASSRSTDSSLVGPRVEKEKGIVRERFNFLSREWSLSFLSMFHSPELSHMVTSKCKGVWDIYIYIYKGCGIAMYPGGEGNG